jgi:hypothetical protein
VLDNLKSKGTLVPLSRIHYSSPTGFNPAEVVLYQLDPGITAQESTKKVKSDENQILSHLPIDRLS